MARHPFFNPRRFGSLLDRAIIDSSVEMMPPYHPRLPVLRLPGRREPRKTFGHVASLLGKRVK
jgi:hypothetical protein